MTRRPRLEVLEDRATPAVLIGLGTGPSANTLAMFESGSPGTITSATAITGLSVGDTVVGIDYRRADNQLYGVAVGTNPLFSTVTTYRINPSSGAVARVGTSVVTVSGATAFGVDIDPFGDEIRVVNDLASDGTGGNANNFRLDPDNGALLGVDPDLDFAGLPGGSANAPSVAIAHTTGAPTAGAARLYGIVSGGDRLVTHTGVGARTLSSVGALGAATTANAGLDIAGTTNTALAVLDIGGKSGLYSVSLVSGAATPIGPVGDGSTRFGDVAISPAEPTVTLTVDPATVVEGGSPVTVTATLSGPHFEDVAVGLTFAGTATKADYTASAAMIDIPAGQTSGTITITAAADGTSEPDETAVVEIATVTGGSESGTQAATVTVTDTDARPTVSLQADAASLAERNGSLTVTVTLSKASGSVVTVPLSFGGAATLDGDYTTAARQLVFLAGQTTQTFAIAAVDDGTDEADESILLGLGAPVNATKGSPAELTLTLVDDEGQSTSPPPVSPPVLPGVRVAVGADAGYDSRAALIAPDGTPAVTLRPFDTAVSNGFAGGARVAVGDVNADGTPDVAVGSGPGRSTEVRVYDGRTQALLFGLGAAFELTFTGGVFVAVGDVTGDGRADVVVTPDQGGGPRVRVLDAATGQVTADFFGIEDPNFRGGARPAVGDVDGDGRGDLIVAAGTGGGPRVAVFDGRRLGAGGGPKLFADFFVFEPTLRNGVYVAAGDLTGDGLAEVIVGGGPGGGPRVYALNGADLSRPGGAVATTEANFFAGDPNSRAGVRVAARDLNGDGTADLITGPGPGGGSKVAVYSGSSVPDNGAPEPLSEFTAFEEFGGGVFVG